MVVEIPLLVGLLAVSTVLGLLAGKLIWGKWAGRLDRLVRKHTALTSRVVALETTNHLVSEVDEWVLNDLSELRKQVEELTATSNLVVELGRGRRHDNFQLIRGIGPKTEALLIERGITTYAQLANLSPEEEATISHLLPGPPNRLERQRWREQAAELAQLPIQKRPRQEPFEEISWHG